MPGLDLTKINFTKLKNGSESVSPLPGIFSQASQENPNTHATNMRMATQLEMPVSAVAGNPEQVSSRLKLDQIDFGAMSTRSPNTEKFLTTYDNAVIAQDDVSLLERLEGWFNPKKAFEGLGQSIKSGFKQQGISTLLAGVDASPDSIYDLIPASAMPYGYPDHLRQRESFKIAAAAGITNDEDFTAAKEETTQQLIGQIKEIQQQRQDFTPEDLTILEEGVRGGVESLAQMAPGFGLMLATGGSGAPMLLAAGLQTTATSYGDARAEGLTPGAAGSFAFIDGALEIATELLPTGTLETILTGEATGKMGKAAIKFLLQEMGTEQIATVTQSLNAYSFGLDEQLKNAESASEITDIMLHRMAVTAVATAVAGGTQAGLVTGIRKAVETLQTDQQQQQTVTEVEQEKLNEMNQMATDSMLRQRSPEAFYEFVKANNPDSKQVYIDGAQVSLYLSENADQIERDGALILLSERAEEAARLGEDITVAIEDFATVIAGTPHFEALKDSMTLSADSVAPFRQAQIEKENQTFIDKLMAEADQNVSEYVQAQEIYTRVRDQLIDSGQVNPQSASVMAQLVPMWAMAFAKENGITIEEAYQQSGLKIEGPQTGEAERLAAEKANLKQGPLKQDFTGFDITQEVEVEETGEVVKITEPAQKLYDRTSKRKNVVEKIQRCVAGG